MSDAEDDVEWVYEEEEYEEYEEAEELEEYDGVADGHGVNLVIPQNPSPPTNAVQQWIQSPSAMPHTLPSVMSMAQPTTSNGNMGEELAPAQSDAEGKLMGKMLDRAYKFEDYEPRRDGWLADVATEIFISTFFKVYFGFFLFTAGVMIGFIFVDWICTTVYFAFSPPGDGVAFVQSFGIISCFFFLSIAMVAAVCMWLDVVKIFVSHSRGDSDLWRISHRRFSTFAQLCCGMCGGSQKDARRERQRLARERQTQPSPWLLYLALIFLVLVFPIFYALISAASQKKSVLYFGQQLVFVTTITVSVILVLLYIWFNARAYMMKVRAVKNRRNEDLSKTIVVDKDGKEKKAKNHWYRSQILLEEFGLDTRTLRWSIVAIPVGLTPIFAINVAMALDGESSNNNAAWVATVLVMCCVLLLIQQVAEARRGHRAVFITLVFIAIYVVLGVVGCAVTGYPASIAVILISFVACQGSLIRKHDHTLTRKEICELLEIPLEMKEDVGSRSSRFDTFLCAGRNTFFALFECFDIHTIFGYRHPKVVEHERALRRQRIGLRSDFKTLMGFWGIVGVFYFFVILIGKACVEKNTSVVSAVGSVGAVDGTTNFPLCKVPIVPVARFTRDLTIVDMAMLAVLSNSFGTDRDVDYATWFSDTPTLRRVYPTVSLFASSALSWEHFADSTTDSHIIVARGSNRGYHWAQHIFTWGEALAFQFASILSPQLVAWDLSDKRNFVKGIGFLKGSYSTDWLPTHRLEEYVSQVRTTSSPNATIVIVGTGFAGGYAKIVAGRLGMTYVSFNAPGVELSWKLFGLNGFSSKSIDVVSQGSLISSVDVQTKEGLLHTIPCSEDSANKCSQMIYTLRTILNGCGDAQGRRLGLTDL